MAKTKTVADQLLAQILMSPQPSAASQYSLGGLSDADALKRWEAQQKYSPASQQARLFQTMGPSLIRTAGSLKESEQDREVKLSNQLRGISVDNEKRLELTQKQIDAVDKVLRDYKRTTWPDTDTALRQLRRMSGNIVGDLKSKDANTYRAKKLALNRIIYDAMMEEHGADDSITQGLKADFFAGQEPGPYIQSEFPVYSEADITAAIDEMAKDSTSAKLFEQAEKMGNIDFSGESAPSQLSASRQHAELMRMAGLPYRSQQYYGEYMAPSGFREVSPALDRYKRRTERFGKRHEAKRERIGERQETSAARHAAKLQRIGERQEAREARQAGTSVFGNFMGRLAELDLSVPFDALDPIDPAKSVSQVQFGKVHPKQIAVEDTEGALPEEEQFEFGEVAPEDLAVEDAEPAGEVFGTGQEELTKARQAARGQRQAVREGRRLAREAGRLGPEQAPVPLSDRVVDATDLELQDSFYTAASGAEAKAAKKEFDGLFDTPPPPVGPLAAGEPPPPAEAMPALSDEAVAGLENVIPGFGLMSQRDQRQQVLDLAQKRKSTEDARKYYGRMATESRKNIAQLGPVAGQLQQEIDDELASFNDRSARMKAAGHWKDERTLGRHGEIVRQDDRDKETMKVAAYQQAKEKHDQKIADLQSQLQKSIQQVENEKANQARYQTQAGAANRALQNIGPSESALQQALEWARSDVPLEQDAGETKIGEATSEEMEGDEPQFKSAVDQMRMEGDEPQFKSAVGDMTVEDVEPEPGESGPRVVGGVGGTVLDEAGAFDSPDKYILGYKKNYDGLFNERVPKEMRDHFFRIEERYGLPPGMLQGIAWVESRFKPGAISKAGAQGMFQIMPKTASEDLKIDPRNYQDWREQADAAARYLKMLHKKFASHADSEEDAWRLSAAAYNTGPGNLTVALRNPRAEFKTKNRDDRGLHPETRKYVGKYDAALKVIRDNQGLAPTWDLQNQQGTDELVDAMGP